MAHRKVPIVRTASRKTVGTRNVPAKHRAAPTSTNSHVFITRLREAIRLPERFESTAAAAELDTEGDYASGQPRQRESKYQCDALERKRAGHEIGVNRCSSGYPGESAADATADHRQNATRGWFDGFAFSWIHHPG